MEVFVHHSTNQPNYGSYPIQRNAPGNQSPLLGDRFVGVSPTHQEDTSPTGHLRAHYKFENKYKARCARQGKERRAIGTLCLATKGRHSLCRLFSKVVGTPGLTKTFACLRNLPDKAFTRRLLTRTEGSPTFRRDTATAKTVL